MTVQAKYTVDTIKQLLGRKLGTYANPYGWRYSGKLIASIELARGGLIRYSDSEGKLFAVFQGDCYLDD